MPRTVKHTPYVKQWKRIKFCERCGVDMEVPKGANRFRAKFCFPCRRIERKRWYQQVYLPWYNGLSADAKKKLSARKRILWDEWVKNNKARRRQIARASYHRNRHKYLKRMRKYRKEYYRRTGR